jgi:hypothetical protein
MWFLLVAWLVLVNSTCMGRQLQQQQSATASYTDLWTAVLG